MRRAVIVVIVGLALAASLWRLHRPAPPAPVNASLYETDMIENLVRGILPDFAADGTPVCFLAFGEGGTAPSSEFISRFAGSQPVVRSCGSAASPPIGKYFDISTGRPGLIVHIIRFKEVVPFDFDVLVSFSNLPSGHDRFTYHISEIGGEWHVKGRTPA